MYGTDFECPAIQIKLAQTHTINQMMAIEECSPVQDMLDGLWSQIAQVPVAVATTLPDSVSIFPSKCATFLPRLTTFPSAVIFSPGLAADMKETLRFVVAHHSA